MATSSYNYKRGYVDHTKGHAFLNNGDIYYSPNCSRPVFIPVQTNSEPYPFHAKTTMIEQFLEPRWWKTAFPYLPFVPLRPSFNGGAFADLHDSACIIRKDVDMRYGLYLHRIANWTALQDLFIHAVHHLQKAIDSPPLLKPIAPSLLGFQKDFSTPSAAQRRALTSRDWFGMWMGLLSFLIANVETIPLLAGNYVEEKWTAILVRAMLPQTWLSSIQTSNIAEFSPECPRAGAILDVLSPELRQPPVEWFCAFNIPVWYHWSNSHNTSAAIRQDLEHLRPPAEVLQNTTTFFTSQPSLHSPWPLPEALPPSTGGVTIKSPGDMTQREFEEARQAVIEVKPWAKFFAAREAENRQTLKSESPQARQTRLNRERKPPKVSADVYVWDWSESDPFQLVRTRVTSREREDMHEFYSEVSGQRIYDSFSNVWDMCEYWGTSDDSSPYDEGHPYQEIEAADLPVNSQLEQDEHEYQDIAGADIHANSRSEQDEHEAFFKSRLAQIGFDLDTSKMDHNTVNLLPPSNTVDILEYLMNHYGFLPPVPVPTFDSTPVNREKWDNCLKSVGLRAGEDNPPLPGLSGPIVNFISGLQSGNTIREQWDILPSHCRSLDRKKLLSFIRRIGGYYFVELAGTQGTSKFAFSHSDSALYAFRILQTNPTLAASSLSVQLVKKGIQFHTLLELDPIPATISLDKLAITIPERLPGYVFGPNDYQVYVQQRARILASPRGRAALLHGGIVARLAREHIAPESAALGPSSAVTDYRLGICVREQTREYWDDKLTDTELDVICGLHHLYTGKGDQIANISWWPLQGHWSMESTGYNWHHWTEWDEVWYQDRLLAIGKGDAKNGIPIPQGKWRDKLKGAGIWRKVTKEVSGRSDAVFQREE